MVTALEIIDTAVKVGLGALVSGAATYFIAKLNHIREIEKATGNRRREMVEGIAQQIQSFTTHALRYWALTCERVEYKRINEKMPADRLSLWDAAYVADGAFPELANAEGQLLLMGEIECANLVRAYGDYVNEFMYKSAKGVDKLAITDLDSTCKCNFLFLKKTRGGVR
jgi:hypothetical protein